jgi:hypothetical protein
MDQGASRHACEEFVRSVRVIKETLRLILVFAGIMLLIRVTGLGWIWPRRQGTVIVLDML